MLKVNGWKRNNLRLVSIRRLILVIEWMAIIIPNKVDFNTKNISKDFFLKEHLVILKATHH